MEGSGRDVVWYQAEFCVYFRTNERVDVKAGDKKKRISEKKLGCFTLSGMATNTRKTAVRRQKRIF